MAWVLKVSISRPGTSPIRDTRTAYPWLTLRQLRFNGRNQRRCVWLRVNGLGAQSLNFETWNFTNPRYSNGLSLANPSPAPLQWPQPAQVRLAAYPAQTAAPLPLSGPPEIFRNSRSARARRWHRSRSPSAFRGTALQKG